VEQKVSRVSCGGRSLALLVQSRAMKRTIVAATKIVTVTK
jgi:hypothetical protein